MRARYMDAPYPSLGRSISLTIARKGCLCRSLGPSLSGAPNRSRGGALVAPAEALVASRRPSRSQSCCIIMDSPIGSTALRAKEKDEEERLTTAPF
ncbi:unnamed protein product [Nesidiocoris tenuis]|uniref:Uncharacterized protein n=1 Tax=Nesidiocoris tenuis TaxID=355587 RepID=A0A6H5GYF6_9HEMI|nr:unnamed protein product [Nesidiocoris tenuis]